MARPLPHGADPNFGFDGIRKGIAAVQQAQADAPHVLAGFEAIIHACDAQMSRKKKSR